MTINGIRGYFENYEIRSIMRDGEAWFFAADVCKVLSLDNTAIRKPDDDEKGLHSTQTPGGIQEISIISESGLSTPLWGAINATCYAGVFLRVKHSRIKIMVWRAGQSKDWPDG
ncbi:TPA: Bro-N domain-containing protein [Salmonella enterica]